MNWLRNNDNPADVDDPGLANLMATCPARSVSGARVVEDSVNWLATTSSSQDVNEPSYGSDEPRGTPMPKGTLTPTQRRRPLTTR
jgi:hypothetical protein